MDILSSLEENKFLIKSHQFQFLYFTYITQYVYMIALTKAKTKHLQGSTEHNSEFSYMKLKGFVENILRILDEFCAAMLKRLEFGCPEVKEIDCTVNK